MNQEEVDQFEKVQAQLESLHFEISALSKKSQNDSLNKFKLKFVNDILEKANAILGSTYLPFTNFSMFDDSELPTNSDVAMMLSQYLSCFEKLRADNVYQNLGQWYWLIDAEKSLVKTIMPKKIKEK